MPGTGGHVAGVRKSSGVRRKKKASSQSRPRTTVAVEKGFRKVLSANEKAEKLTYTR